MTKLRSPDSIEAGVLRALDLLGEDAASAVTGKSARLIRAWSDPDDDVHQIRASDAIKLDAACVLAGHAAPLQQAYAAALRLALAARGGAPAHDAQDPRSRLAAVVAELGDVGRALQHAVAPTSPGGVRLTRAEMLAVRKQVDEVRAEVDRLDRDIAAQGGDRS